MSVAISAGRICAASPVLLRLPRRCDVHSICTSRADRKRQQRSQPCTCTSAGADGSRAAAQSRMSAKQVAFFVPNLIGYLRLGLLGAAICIGTIQPAVTFWMFASNLLLDGVDGIAARRLNQCSAFGAFLDVLVDNLVRGVLWVWSTNGPWGAFPPVLESTVFVCTHAKGGAAWKTGCFSKAPRWVQSVMANGFKTPIGSLAIAGLMGLPLHLWACRFMPDSLFAAPPLGKVLIVGRLLCASVEIWVLFTYVRALLVQDAAAHATPAADQ